MDIEEEILVCAVRYALGRMTYVVSDVCNYIKARAWFLSDQCKRVMINDIEHDLDACRRMGIRCGMDCDERDWLDLLEALKGGTNG